MRDAIWAVRGRAIANPPWPGDVRSLLFLCHANLCRSPFAEQLAQQRLREVGLSHIACTSAGFRINPLVHPPEDAVAVAARYCVQMADHQPVFVTLRHVQVADAVFVMEARQWQLVRRRWPARANRFFLLPQLLAPDTSLGAWDRLHIPDPYGRGEAAFEQSYERIARAVDEIVALLGSQRTGRYSASRL